MWTDQQGQPLLTAADVAHQTRQHVKTVRRHFRAGEYPGAIKIGREYRISRADLAAYLESKKQPAERAA